MLYGRWSLCLMVGGAYVYGRWSLCFRVGGAYVLL